MRSFVVAVGLGACAHRPTPLPEPEVCFAELAGALSDDTMEGRGLGTAGLDRATDLVAAALAGALGPRGDVRLQEIEVVTGVARGADNRLDDGQPLPADVFAPAGFSASGAFSGEVVFVGYGIRATELGYDDYAGVDVRGKVALAMRFEPGEDDEASPFEGRRPSRYSDLRRKALHAREAGATALLLVTPTDDASEPDKVPEPWLDGPEPDAGLPVLFVTRAAADRWLGAEPLATRRAAIDAATAPRSVGTGVTLTGAADVQPTTAAVANVVGVLPGDGPLADEVVVLGAHLDHLGRGGHGSLRPGVDAIHNGADDNASGVAASICAVPAIVERTQGQDRRTLVVVGFTAEEIGLAGSAAYVRDPIRPIADTVAMVNLDMVGRVRDGKISALGSDTSAAWAPWVTAAATEAGLDATLGGDGYGPSDHMSFYTAGVPVVHLFSGTHDEYHTPDDDAALLNVVGGRAVTTLTAALVTSALTDPVRPTLVAPTAEAPVQGDARGFGAYLGTVPDYAAMASETGGVLLSGVRAGGPADRAGVRGGDVLVEVAGTQIENLYDLTFVLRDHRPGETVDVVVLREGARLSLSATLGRRGAEPSAAHPTVEWSPTAGVDASNLLDPREVHLADLRRLTFDGENAEAYFSPDGRRLIFQRTPADPATGAPVGCDQQHTLDLTTGDVVRLSSGLGRTTCGYFEYPSGDRALYATTEGSSPECPPPPDRSQGYVWPLYEYDLVWQDATGARTPFLPHPGYDAEATICMADGRVLFTSTRDGDLDLYVANADGTGLRRLTDTVGYDGGAFFTPDCSGIVWRASRPTGTELDDYRALLGRGLVRPSRLELFWMNADGTGVRQLTSAGAGSFGPYPLPGNTGAIFASNLGGSPREFDLYTVDREGGAPQQVTFTAQFDGFPMFSPDGKWLVFGSNRGTTGGGTDVYIARWVP